jgi:hypothetical protein
VRYSHTWAVSKRARCDRGSGCSRPKLKHGSTLRASQRGFLHHPRPPAGSSWIEKSREAKAAGKAVCPEEIKRLAIARTKVFWPVIVG